MPFVYHQRSAYQIFCLNALPLQAVWCSSMPPLIYTYVQDKYWNIGFLRYWTLSQAPNILLALPVLLSIMYFAFQHIQKSFLPRVLNLPHLVGLSFPSYKQAPPPSRSLFMKHSLAPHAIHSMVLALLLLFSAHTQIALRLAASLPLTYWAAANLMIENPRIGKWWVTWSVVWGATSIVLWSVFLPPA